MQFDIIIIGGGMVGATLACALTNSSLRIALVDSQPQSPMNDARLIALNHGSISLFKKLHLFEKLAEHAAPIEQVHVSHRGHFGATRIHAAELKLPALGFVVPAAEINLALEQQLHQTTVQIIRPATLIGLVEKQDSIHLTLKTPDGEKHIQGKIIIAADGTHSTMRDLLAIPTEKHDYQQSAIVTVTCLLRPHKNIAYERFLAKGAIAMLPLVGNRCATIWTAPNDIITHLMQLSDDQFLQELQKEFGSRLGCLAAVAKRALYPLQFVQVKKQAHGRIVLIGNAAHTVHPLAAQGLNLAFDEITRLLEIMADKPLDTIDMEVFNHYPFSQKLNTQLSHYLNILFSIDFLPVNIIRQIGMIGLDICGIMKRQFAAYPVGQSRRSCN